MGATGQPSGVYPPRAHRLPGRGHDSGGGNWIEYGDEIRIYYVGFSGSHNLPSESRMGLARLPQERIVARAAGDELGVLLTKPFQLEGNRLEINANAAWGLIKVESDRSARKPHRRV